jgi:uncharacterized protein YbjT (DUF2867 family)
MFGSGTTRLQPAHVEDVAEAIARILQGTERGPKTLECGGPRVYTYKELLSSIASEAGAATQYVSPAVLVATKTPAAQPVPGRLAR